MVAGAVARFLGGGAEKIPSLKSQLRLIDELYEEMLLHYGRDVGRRHARKHLGWALDVAAETACVAPSQAKAHRYRILTAEEPIAVRRYLARAYAAFAENAGGGLAPAHTPAQMRLDRDWRRTGRSRCPPFPPARRMQCSMHCRIRW